MNSLSENEKSDRSAASASPVSSLRRRKVALRPNPRLVGNYEGSSRTIEEVRLQIQKQGTASA